MAFPTDTFLQFIRNGGSWIAQEFENFYAQLEGYLNVQHKSDGSHGDITGDSLTLTANGTTGTTGNLDADGHGTFGGNLIADNGTTDHCELGLQTLIASEALESGLLIGGKTKGFFFHAKVEASPGAGTGKELRLWNLNDTSVSIFRLVYDSGNSRWLLGVETSAKLALGENASGKRIDYGAFTTINLGGGTDLSTYAEGTWTPVLKFGGGTTGITYTNQLGFYTRIGRLVTVHVNVILTSKGSSSGAATIAGLPFAPASNGSASLACGFYSNFAAGVTSIAGFALAGATTITLQTNGAGGTANLDDTSFTNTSSFILTCSYFV